MSGGKRKRATQKTSGKYSKQFDKTIKNKVRKLAKYLKENPNAKAQPAQPGKR